MTPTSPRAEPDRHPVTPDLSAVEERAWVAYQRMHGLLASHLNRQLSTETGLSDADYEILAALAAAPGHHLRALALRCTVQWEKSRLSHHLTRMQRRGLVVREDCAEDSRGAVFRLTSTGRTAVEAARSSRIDAIRTYVIGPLTPDQVDALADISEAILGRLATDDEHRHAAVELARETL